jgi:hypothetical protein
MMNGDQSNKRKYDNHPIEDNLNSHSNDQHHSFWSDDEFDFDFMNQYTDMFPHSSIQENIPSIDTTVVHKQSLDQQKRKSSTKEKKETNKMVPKQTQSQSQSSSKTNPLPVNEVYRMKKSEPTRDAKGFLNFPDFPEFRPNLTPKEILQRGSFGGTAFQPFTSKVTGETYPNAWEEFPPDWFQGLERGKHYANDRYDKSINMYQVTCNTKLSEWEDNGWVSDLDPYGWFQWYCRFYLGRRTSDDHRQIFRAINMMGSTGRWKKNLINKCITSGKSMEESIHDYSISPKVRQLLQVTRAILYN